MFKDSIYEFLKYERQLITIKLLVSNKVYKDNVKIYNKMASIYNLRGTIVFNQSFVMFMKYGFSFGDSLIYAKNRTLAICNRPFSYQS